MINPTFPRVQEDTCVASATGPDGQAATKRFMLQINSYIDKSEGKAVQELGSRMASANRNELTLDQPVQQTSISSTRTAIAPTETSTSESPEDLYEGTEQHENSQTLKTALGLAASFWAGNEIGSGGNTEPPNEERGLSDD